MGQVQSNPCSWWQPAPCLTFTASMCISNFIHASPSPLFSFLGICWPTLSSTTPSICFQASSFISSLVFLPTFQEFSVRSENGSCRVWQIPFASSPSCKPRDTMFFFTLPPPPLNPPKHNFPSFSQLFPRWPFKLFPFPSFFSHPCWIL